MRQLVRQLAQRAGLQPGRPDQDRDRGQRAGAQHARSTAAAATSTLEALDRAAAARGVCGSCSRTRARASPTSSSALRDGYTTGGGLGLGLGGAKRLVNEFDIDSRRARARASRCAQRGDDSPRVAPARSTSRAASRRCAAPRAALAARRSGFDETRRGRGGAGRRPSWRPTSSSTPAAARSAASRARRARRRRRGPRARPRARHAPTSTRRCATATRPAGSAGHRPRRDRAGCRRRSTCSRAPGRGTALLAAASARPAAEPRASVGGVVVPIAGETGLRRRVGAARASGARVRCCVADGLGHGADAARRRRAPPVRELRAGRSRPTRAARAHARRAAADARRRGGGRAHRSRRRATRALCRRRQHRRRDRRGRTEPRRLVSHNGTLGHNVAPHPGLRLPRSSRAALLVMHSDGIRATGTCRAIPGSRGATRCVDRRACSYRDYERGRDDVSVVVARGEEAGVTPAALDASSCATTSDVVARAPARAASRRAARLRPPATRRASPPPSRRSRATRSATRAAARSILAAATGRRCCAIARQRRRARHRRTSTTSSPARYRSPTGMGLGLVGVQPADGRLRDRRPARARHAVVDRASCCPPRAALTPARPRASRDELAARGGRASPYDEVTRQNQELLRALGELRARQEELLRAQPRARGHQPRRRRAVRRARRARRAPARRRRDASRGSWPT